MGIIELHRVSVTHFIPCNVEITLKTTSQLGCRADECEGALATDWNFEPQPAAL